MHMSEVVPSTYFMKECGSSIANFFFFTLSHKLKCIVQCRLRIKTDSVCLFTTGCLLILFYL